MNYSEAEPSEYQNQERCAKRIKKLDFFSWLLALNPSYFDYLNAIPRQNLGGILLVKLFVIRFENYGFSAALFSRVNENSEPTPISLST